MTLIDCYIEVDGEHFADTAQDYVDHRPVALADLSLAWGRHTVVDQPEAAVVTFRVIDQAGGESFLDVLHIGAPVDVRASGTVALGGATDVVVDGSFETLALGDAGARVLQGPATVVNTTAFHGAKSLRIEDPGAEGDMWVTIGPDFFDIGGAPQSWDDIPTFQTGDQWQMSLAMRAGIDAQIKAYTIYLDGPRHDDQSSYLPNGTWPWTWGTNQWQDRTVNHPSIPAQADDKWPGIHVHIILQTWAGLPGIGDVPHPVVGSWAQNPHKWNDYAGGWVDYARMIQYTAPVRDVLVFSGEITDIRARTTADGKIEVEATAVDQLAELGNRYIGDVPWPVETVTNRINRIITGLDVDVLNIPVELGALLVTRRDVDRQPVAGLLQSLAAGIDAVLWSATHSTTGPYLWFEDPQRRIAVANLEEQGGWVVIVGAVEAGVTVTACQFNGDVEWIRNVGDVLTRIDATWQDQSTTPEVTERNAPTVIDVTSEADIGARHLSISTPLVSESDAVTVAGRMLTRTRQLQWRAEQLVWPLERIAVGDTETIRSALDLLDGTIRLGRGLLVTDIAYWPVGESAGMYLDGGDYRFDENGWELTLHTTPQAGFGESVTWNDLHPPAPPEAVPTAYVTFPATADNDFYTDQEQTLVLGNLVLQARLRLNGTGTANRTIAEMWRRGYGTSRWIWRFDSAGKPSLIWSAGGTTQTRLATAAIPLSQWVYLRTTLDASVAGNHVVTFETSTDAVTWTLLGTPVTTAGSTVIDPGSSFVSFGGARGSALGLLGSLAECSIGNGVATLVEFRARYDLANVAVAATQFNLTSGQKVIVEHAGSPATVLTPPPVPPAPGVSWRWNQFHPSIEWDELWGVAA